MPAGGPSRLRCGVLMREAWRRAVGCRSLGPTSESSIGPSLSAYFGQSVVMPGTDVARVETICSSVVPHRVECAFTVGTTVPQVEVVCCRCRLGAPAGYMFGGDDEILATRSKQAARVEPEQLGECFELVAGGDQTRRRSFKRTALPTRSRRK
jgi:hypothetical protein